MSPLVGRILGALVGACAALGAIGCAEAQRHQLPAGAWVAPGGAESIWIVDDRIHFDIRALGGDPTNKIDPEHGYEYCAYSPRDAFAPDQPGWTNVYACNSPPSGDPVHYTARFYWDGKNVIRQDFDGQRTVFLPTAAPR